MSHLSRNARTSFVLAAAAAAAAMAAGGMARADITTFDDDANTGNGATGWTYNANVAAGNNGVPALLGPDLVEMTNNANEETTSIWYNTPQDVTAFNASFTWNMLTAHNGGNVDPADGIAFVLQNSAGGLFTMGDGGGGKGYGGANLDSSIATFVDNYAGSPGDIGMGLNGDARAPYPGGPVNLRALNEPIDVEVSYDGRTYTQSYTQGANNITKAYVIDLARYLGGGTTATVGFTGATGGLNSQQQLSNFLFDSVAPTASAPRTELDFHNTGGANTWHSTANWDVGAVPGEDFGNAIWIDSDRVFLDSGTAGSVTRINAVEPKQVGRISVSNSNTLTVETGGDLKFVHGLKIGEGSPGTFNMTGGTIHQTGMAGDGDRSWIDIGFNGGAATFNMSGGTIITDSRESGFLFARGGAASAVVNQTGGLIDHAGFMNIGDAMTVGSQAQYNISGGTLRSNREIIIGAWDNANAEVNISGTAVVETHHLRLARSGVVGTSTGVVNHTGGTVTFSGEFDIAIGGAAEGGSDGEYNISGNAVLQQTESGDWNRIGRSGPGNAGTPENPADDIPRVGVLNISDNALVSFESRTHLAAEPGSHGTVNQTGGIFEVRNGNGPELIIADNGGIEGGAVAVGNSGTYNISGGILRTTAGNINVGHWDHSNGNLNVSGTALVQTATHLGIGTGRELADNGITPTPSTGVVTQTGGTVEVGTNLDIASGNVSQNGTYNLSGGTLKVTGDINAGNNGGTAAFNHTGGRLQGVANFNGPAGYDQQGGTFAPGASPGTTNINGNYNQAVAAVYEAEVEGDGSAHDLVVVTGTATIAGGLDVLAAAANPVGYVPIPILTSGGLTGRFPNAEVDGATATANGLSLAPVYDADSVELVPAIPGDANLDRTVSVGDVGVLATHFGGLNKFWENADFNFDGTVSVADVGILATNFGRTFGGLTDTSMTFEQALALPEFAEFRATLAAVPEPGTLSLLGVAAGGLLARRRRRSA